MLIELIRKEFIAKRDLSNKSVVSAVFSYLLKVILLAGFIALECFIALSLDKKINKYSPYGSYDFLVFFLFIVMVIGIFYSTVSSRKVIFDSGDGEIILRLPISPTNIILSKIIYLYLKDVLLELFVATPLLICFGISHSLMARFFVFAILYPIFISLFSIGVSLLLSVLYQWIYKKIKQSDIAQFIIAAILVIGLCFAYKVVLDMFLLALSDSSVGGVFSDSFINGIHDASVFFLPVRNITMIVVSKTNILQNIAILLGMIILSLTLGIGVSSLVYSKMLRSGNSREAVLYKKNKPFKVKSVSKALIKKEMDLLFKDGTNMFSYTSLLIMAPFLTYVVISSLNGVIFSDLKFYATYFPELVSAINLALVLLFAGIINSSASMSMSREGKCIQIVKYSPIPLSKQIICKLLIPVIFSEGSFIVTLLVLLITSAVSYPVLLASLFIGTLMILWNNAFGLYADMHDHSSAKSKLGIWNNVVPIVLPLVLLGIHFVLTTYTLLDVLYVYLIECGFVLLCLAPFFINIGKRYKKAFSNMEVRL